MKIRHLSSIAPLVFTGAAVLLVISVYEWVDEIFWPHISPDQQHLHLHFFIAFVCCVTAFFITRYLKANSIITSIVESSEDGIIGQDLDGKVTSWNDGAQGIYGYCLEEVKGRPLSMLVPSGAVDEFSIALDSLKQGRRVEYLEAARVRKDDELIHVSMTVSPIRNAAGMVTGVSTIVRDITEKKRMEEALQSAKESLELEVKKRTVELEMTNEQLRKEIQEREQIQKALQLERDRFMNILDSMEDRVYIANRDCDIQYANPAIEREFGPAGGRKCYEYLHGIKDVCAGCRQKEVYSGKSVRWVATSARNQKTYDFFDMPLKNADGSISRLQIFRDITEYKRVEEALRESEERYRTLFYQANDAVYVLGLNPEGAYSKFIEFNDNLCRMLGYTKEQFLSLSYLDVVAPESIDNSLMAKDKLVKQKHLLTERLFVAKDGKRIPVEVSSHLFDYKGQPNVLAIARNIAERKQAQESLRQSEIKYRKLAQEFDTLLHAIDDTLVLLSPEMEVLWTNNGPVYQLNESVAEAVGKCCHELLYGRSQPCSECPVKKAFRTGEVETQVSSGSGKFLDMRAFPIKDGDKVISVILLVIDITEKMTMQAEAMQTSHLASLGELAAGVAHEINNPINGIINYAQILIDECASESMENDLGKRMMKEGERIADIVKSLLSFARGGRDDKWPVRIDAVLKESLILTQAQIRKESIRLDTSMPDDLPEIEANLQKLQQVFLNIINNARYALNEKYPARHDDKVLEIRGESINVDGREHVRITFYDRGTGIPPDKLSLLTKPFYSTKPFDKGTGLGLAITQRIISDHGGRLDFESAQGEFTKVIVLLPTKGLLPAVRA